MSQCLHGSLAASKGQATTITVCTHPQDLIKNLLLVVSFSLQRLEHKLCFNKEFSFVLSNSNPDLILKWNSSWVRL